MGWLSAIFGRGRRKKRLEVEGAIRAVLDAEGPDAAWGRTAAALRADPEADGLLHLAAHVLRVGNEPRTAELFDRAADAPHDPQRLFELGSELLSEEQPELSAVLLERALRFVPFDAVVRSELALAHARSGHPDRVLATLALHPCLADDAGALFEFGWASMLTGDLDAGFGALRELHGAPALRRKLKLALARARHTACRDARDFYFVEHGALLLDGKGPLGGRYAAIELDPPRLAQLLVDAVAVLEILEVERGGPVYVLDEAHRPLAAQLAGALGRDLQDVPAEGRLPAGILPLWDGALLEELGRRAYEGPGTVVFAVRVDPAASLVHAPELVGLFAREVERQEPMGQLPVAEPSDARDYAEARRDLLFGHGPRVPSAYVPDAPLPL